jgi:tellurite resistance protein TehA-like permease
MNTLIGYLASVALATTLALTIVFLSRKSLRQLLVELCGSGARAEFWTMFAGLFLMLCTLFGVLASLPRGDSKVGSENPDLVGAISTFRSGVLALLIASICVACVLLRSIARFEQLASRKPPSFARQPPFVSSVGNPD